MLSNISQTTKCWFSSAISTLEWATIKAPGLIALVTLVLANAMKMVNAFWSFAPIITSVLQTHSLAWSCTIGSRGCTPDLKTGTNSTSSSQDGNTLITFVLQGHTTVLIVTLITPLSARRSSYVQRSSIASNNLLHFALMLLPLASLKMSLFSTTSWAQNSETAWSLTQRTTVAISRTPPLLQH